MDQVIKIKFATSEVAPLQSELLHQIVSEPIIPTKHEHKQRH